MSGYPYQGSLFSQPNGQGKYLGADVNSQARAILSDIASGRTGANVFSDSFFAPLQVDPNVDPNILKAAQDVNSTISGAFQGGNQTLANQAYARLFPLTTSNDTTRNIPIVQTSDNQISTTQIPISPIDVTSLLSKNGSSIGLGLLVIGGLLGLYFLSK